MSSWTKGAVAAGLLGCLLGPGVGIAAPPAGALPAKQYTMCDFSDPAAPTGNPYPFRRALSTADRDSRSRNVRIAVRSIQEMLRFWGYTKTAAGEVPVDGRYGRATAAAVKDFQKAHYLPVTGKVNTKTWRAIGSDSCWMLH